MSRRWNWDFEDGQRPPAVRKPAPPEPPPANPAPPADSARFRRRRVGVALIAALIVVLIAAVLAASHRGSTSPPSARAGARSLAPAPAPPPQRQAREQQAVAAVLAYTPFVKEGTASAPNVALTFDDGPGPYTPGVLGALERGHARATFFAIGKMERYFGAATVRAL